MKWLISHFDNKLSLSLCLCWTLVSHAEEKERTSCFFLLPSCTKNGKIQRPLHFLVLSDFIWVVFKNNGPEMEALQHDWWLLFLSASWKYRKGFFSLLVLTAYWYKSYFHFAAELICNIGVWVCIFFFTGLSQSISQQDFCRMMDYVAKSLPVMFPLKGWAYCHHLFWSGIIQLLYLDISQTILFSTIYFPHTQYCMLDLG